MAGGADDGCQPVIERIDPKTNRLRATVDLPSGSGALAIDPSSVWPGMAGALGRVDPTANALTGQLSLPGTPFGEAVGFGFVWLGDRDSDAVYVVRPG